MPGVLQLEAMAQVSSVLMLRKPENTGKIGYFMSADNVKWRRPVLPGDTLFIETEILNMRGSIGQTRCRCLVNGEVISEAELKFALMYRCGAIPQAAWAQAEALLHGLSAVPKYTHTLSDDLLDTQVCRVVMCGMIGTPSWPHTHRQRQIDRHTNRQTDTQTQT